MHDRDNQWMRTVEKECYLCKQHQKLLTLYFIHNIYAEVYVHVYKNILKISLNINNQRKYFVYSENIERINRDLRGLLKRNIRIV